MLLKGAKNKHLWSGLYNGVGGHIEQGEDVLSAASRELFEETALTSSNLCLCGIVTVDTQTNPGVCIFLFIGECPEYEPSFSSEGALEWIKLTDINNIPLVVDLPMLLPKIMAYKPGSPVFFAHSSYDGNGNVIVRFG
jgi:8-oxo-dGTP diphosphatase